ncbi:MAG: DUF4276 family protein [Burkholderiaceae bacterium]
MNWIEVLVEGSSDVPAVREVLTRKFALTENSHFRIHPHNGRGYLPGNLRARPELQNRSLLHQLPSKLRGYGTWFTNQHWVLVVVDADDTPCHTLLAEMQTMLSQLEKPPRVLFRIAVEETESWFIADTAAVKKAYPNAAIAQLKNIPPDAVCGAWEKLAEAIHSAGNNKTAWAEAISPHLNLHAPPSPSLRKLIEGVERELNASSNSP